MFGKSCLDIMGVSFEISKCDGLYVLGSGSGAIRRCGFIGVGVALLQEVHQCGYGQREPLRKPVVF